MLPLAAVLGTAAVSQVTLKWRSHALEIVVGLAIVGAVIFASQLVEIVKNPSKRPRLHWWTWKRVPAPMTQRELMATPSPERTESILKTVKMIADAEERQRETQASLLQQYAVPNRTEPALVISPKRGGTWGGMYEPSNWDFYQGSIEIEVRFYAGLSEDALERTLLTAYADVQLDDREVQHCESRVQQWWDRRSELPGGYSELPLIKSGPPMELSTKFFTRTIQSLKGHGWLVPHGGTIRNFVVVDHLKREYRIGSEIDFHVSHVSLQMQRDMHRS